jgi:hypothetical protein
MSQFAKPAVHDWIAHAPAMHTTVALLAGHTLPQPPQLDVSDWTLTSHPLDVFMSQFRYPGLQTIPHAPLLHTAVECVPDGQTFPQVLQLLASVLVFTSQPLAAMLSQFPKPGLHVPSAHVWVVPLAWHCEFEFGRLQVSPQKLQFWFVPSVVEQTPAGSPGQFAVPLMHVVPQTPMVQVCAPTQPVPHCPQFFGSLWTLASHPSVGSLLQSLQPASQLEMTHFPAVQSGVACASTQAWPQPPQFAGSSVVSTH